MSHPDHLPLNRSEHLYWAGEGLYGPVNMAFMLRFAGPVAEADVRRSLRALVSAYPRLRGVIQPGWVRHHLRILPDNPHVDLLFADAYRVQPGVDPSNLKALEAFHGPFLNEPMPLERGLPWRARFFPHDATPALMFSVHHIAGDGRSMIDALCGLMAELNGHTPAACPLDVPSMLPAVLPQRWQDWPASIAAWWRNTRAVKQFMQTRRVVSLATHRSNEFAPTQVHHCDLQTPPQTLRRIAKAMGTTSNTLLTAMLAEAFLSLAHDDPNAVAAIRISVDLRRYFPQGRAPRFGNHVATMVVRARRQPDLAHQVADIDAQAKAGLASFEQRQHALPLLFYEWLPLMGKTLYSRMLIAFKRRGKLDDVSCHFTNLGDTDAIHPEGAGVRLAHMWPATNSTGLLVATGSLAGRQFMVLSHPQDEIPAEAVHQFSARLDRQLQALETLRAAA